MPRDPAIALALGAESTEDEPDQDVQASVGQPDREVLETALRPDGVGVVWSSRWPVRGPSPALASFQH